jgi:transcriptional regulator with XRE-family HTH domain
VGAQLRRLREAKGFTREEAGYVIRGSGSKISRLELGRVSFKERDIADLLTFYGVEDTEQREALFALARDANSPGWWHDYDDVVASWFETYVGLEEAASMIRSYEVQFIPGLLQTEDYARAVILAGRPDLTAEEAERRVHLRTQRQRLFHREDRPALLWVVVDEAALRRPMGGARVMRGQLDYLLEVTSLSTITIQVMPFRCGGHAAEGGAFSILRFPEQDLPDIVYVEQLVSALYLDKREHVDRYLETMNRLTLDSQPPELSRETLSKLRSAL